MSALTKDAYGRLARWQDALLEPLNGPLRDIGLGLYPPRPGMRVLDVGCGTGAQLQRYLDAGCAVAGIDSSPAMLARAEDRLGPAADLRLGDARELPFEDASFDLVTATLVVHEIAPGDRDLVGREMLRVLASDGRLLITDFHAGLQRFPKGTALRAVSTVAELIARHRDRSRSFLAEGGVPTFARRLHARVEQTKVVAGGNLALHLLAPPT